MWSLVAHFATIAVILFLLFSDSLVINILKSNFIFNILLFIIKLLLNFDIIVELLGRGMPQVMTEEMEKLTSLRVAHVRSPTRPESML